MLSPDDQSITFIQSISFITISSTVITIASDEQARTTVIPVKTQTLASLVPYIASGSSTPSPKSSFPVTPIAAAVAGVVVIAVSAALLIRSTARPPAARSKRCRQSHIQPPHVLGAVCRSAVPWEPVDGGPKYRIHRTAVPHCSEPCCKISGRVRG
ncbi:hypothetical protein C8R43DRAFT_337658 [Mycena crocata]|nr:hypothetical protein C8R43DRAFT_337658 [Mycena crocata]